MNLGLLFFFDIYFNLAFFFVLSSFLFKVLWSVFRYGYREMKVPHLDLSSDSKVWAIIGNFPNHSINTAIN